MKASSILVTALMVCLPTAARAIDVTVKYDVDATALKQAVAGTPLTYSLYADAACTVPVDSQIVNIEDVDTIEVLKRFTPKNATKLPKTARTWLTYSITPNRWFSHVTVTGTGVTPVGGACQAQFRSPASAVAASVPAGIVVISGPYASVASLAVTAPDSGTAVLTFETEMEAFSPNQQITCFLTDNAALVASFEMDTGDVDSPIPLYDLRQTHTVTAATSQGAHLYDVSCSIPSGPDVNTFGARLVAAFFGATM
jgi:hypothetical protein